VAHLEPGFIGWTDAEAEVKDITDTAGWVKREKSR
jgi:hypothetical protein